MAMRQTLFTRGDRGLDPPLTPEQKESLERAVAKIVALGSRTGIGPEEMIQLLKSGLTVGELLDYISSQSRELDLTIARRVCRARPD